MAKLSLKVYLMMPDLDTYREVRRFGIDADVASNFLYLHEKLQTIFPDLRGKIFTVTWKDDEDENVTISTNEELEIALDEMGKKGIYKMYVWLQPMQDGIDMSKIEKTIHPGVQCDVCDKNIHGFRFKCMQCRDYDLCTDCMTLGNHLEHYMIRMTQPVEWSSYHGHRLAHHVRKFIQKAQHKEDERKCSKGSHKGLHKRSGCPAFNAAEFGKSGRLFDLSVVDVLENFITDICAAPADERQEKKRAKEQHREPSAESATEATEDAQQEATRHSFSQLLKIVEDNISNISQFLDPLGINVTVMADNDTAKNKPAENSAQTKTGAQKPAETYASAEDSAKKFPGEGKKLRDDPVSTATVPSMDNAQKDSAAAAPVAAAAATAASTSTSAEQAAEAEEWTMIQRESSVSPTSSLSSLNGAIPKQVAPPSAPTAPAAEPEKTPSSQRLYPPLPEEVRPENLSPKIQRAVDAMMAMGFTNEGAWLTHLLIAQNGDIDKALDVIHPVRRH